MGLINPIVVKFKCFFQKLCIKDLGWDDAIEGDLLKIWQNLVKKNFRLYIAMVHSHCSQFSGCSIAALSRALCKEEMAAVYSLMIKRRLKEYILKWLSSYHKLQDGVHHPYILKLPQETAIGLFFENLSFHYDKICGSCYPEFTHCSE